MLNFDFWGQEWPLIVGAPHIAIGGALVIAAATFAFAKLIYSGQIAAMKAQMATLHERRHLAEDQQKALTWQIEKLKAEQVAVNLQIEQKATLPALASSTATVTRTIGELATTNSALGNTLTPDVAAALDNARWLYVEVKTPTKK